MAYTWTSLPVVGYFYSTKIINVSRNKEVELCVRGKTLYAWAKSPTNVISTNAVSAVTHIIHKKKFDDNFRKVDLEKLMGSNISSVSVSGNKLKLTNNQIGNEYNIFSLVEFTNDFNVQVKIVANVNSNKTGIVISSKANTLSTPLYNIDTVTNEPIIGAYVSGGNLYSGVLNNSPSSVVSSLPVYVKIVGTYATKTINIFSSTDNVNWTLRFSEVNPTKDTNEISWPLCISLSNVSTILNAYSQFSDFKINSGDYCYITN